MRVRGRTAQLAVLAALCAAVTGVSLVPPARAPASGTRLGVAVARAARVAAGLGVRVPPVLAGTRRRVIRWQLDGVARELVDVAPVGAAGPLPLVVVLHGRRQTPWQAERTAQWDRLAAEHRAVIGYGAGYAGSWNAGSCCGRAARARLDDSTYVLRAIRLEEQRHDVDRHRVFVVGFSNGGMLALRFACEHASALSALAIVGASLQTACRPSRGLSVLAVSGDEDTVVPYDGSRFSRVAGAPTPSLPRSLRPWLLAARGTGAVVRVVRLPGVGHDWPTTRRGGWDATAQLWRFLVAHPAATT